uniref:Uncharacterized protein n=1 Tax=Knipowitschia caucasica TaxID=637954 RepID=A0AAV2KHW7_KNICA
MPNDPRLRRRQSAGPARQSTGPARQSTGPARQSTGPARQSAGPGPPATYKMSRCLGASELQRGGGGSLERWGLSGTDYAAFLFCPSLVQNIEA